jgi:alanyl-tRNA synthetase
MKAHDVRRSFLDFFGERGHRVLPSSPLVLPNDPTLLFANAGMNQFKDVFTGAEASPHPRAATSQKCLRVSGKHNDLEMVGRTPRHHTFFEMLGNFSFGDYFKADAIAFAWELITGVYGLPAERLWVSVFRGNDDVPADDEAFALWRDKIGVPEGRILRLGEAENFWRMGDTGPCGPCSEIHYDLGEALSSVDGVSTPETDDRRFLEIWNLVFMQFDQQPGGYEALPSPSIDTGMGLERIVSVLQGKQSNYDTDVFAGLLGAIATRAGSVYGADEERDFSMRVIADHARAFCFLVSDGVVPANDKRGYVLRRLLRRAIRHGRKLGINEPFLHEVTPVVFDELGGVYPELLASRDAIVEVGRLEEQRFGDTLSTGLSMLEDSLAAAPDKVLPGKDLFRLYDTFGFPLDLARDIAEERGVQLDEAGFEVEMTRQRERAQASWKGGARRKDRGIWQELPGAGPTTFLGYERSALDDVPVLAIARDGAWVERLAEGDAGEVLLEATPFYAESGGQEADHGWLRGSAGRAAVLDVQRQAAGRIVHRVRVDQGGLAVGQTIRAEIDDNRRLAIRRNHTATHLLHAALREVVGTHVKQAGSLVAADRLRFDFTHFAGLSDEGLADIETLVNRQVLANLPVETEVLDLDRALSLGAMALFGEKYGDRVRTVRMGAFSLELCGGTHTGTTAEVGLVKLVGERGVASGTRRIEAVSGEGSLARFRAEHALVRRLEEHLSVPGDQLLEELERRSEQARSLQRDLERQRVGGMREQLLESALSAPEVAGVKVFTARTDGLSPQEMRELADALRGTLRSGVAVLGRAEEGKVSLLVAVTQDLTGKVRAGDLVKTLGRIIGGGGGGRPDMAEAGGKDPARLDEALGAAAEEVKRCMQDGES